MTIHGTDTGYSLSHTRPWYKYSTEDTVSVALVSNYARKEILLGKLK